MGFPLKTAGMTFMVSSPNDSIGDPATAVTGGKTEARDVGRWSIVHGRYFRPSFT